MPTTRRRAAAAAPPPPVIAPILPPANRTIAILTHHELHDILSVDDILSAHTIRWEEEDIIAHTFLHDPSPLVVRYKDAGVASERGGEDEEMVQEEKPPAPFKDISAVLADVTLVHCLDSFPTRLFNVGTFSWWELVKGLEVDVNEATKKHSLKVGEGELKRIFSFFGMHDPFTNQVWDPRRKETGPNIFLPWILPITIPGCTALVVLPSFQALAWKDRAVPITLLTLHHVSGMDHVLFGAAISQLVRVFACYADANIEETKIRPRPSAFLFRNTTQRLEIFPDDEGHPEWKETVKENPTLAYTYLAMGMASQGYALWNFLWDAPNERPDDWQVTLRQAFQKILALDTQPDPLHVESVLTLTKSLAHELLLLLRLQGFAGCPEIKLPAFATSEADTFAGAEAVPVARFLVPLLEVIKQKNAKWLEKGAGRGLRSLLGSMYLSGELLREEGVPEGEMGRYMKTAGEKKILELFQRVKIYMSELALSHNSALPKPTSIRDPPIFCYPDHRTSTIKTFPHSVLVEHLFRNTYSPEHFGALTTIIRLSSTAKEKTGVIPPEVVVRMRQAVDDEVGLMAVKDRLVEMEFHKKEALVLVDFLPWGKQTKEVPKVEEVKVKVQVDRTPSATPDPDDRRQPSPTPSITAPPRKKHKGKQKAVEEEVPADVPIGPRVIPTSHALVILHPSSLFELNPDPRKPFSIGWTHPYIHFQKAMWSSDAGDMLNVLPILDRFLAVCELAAPAILDEKKITHPAERNTVTRTMQQYKRLRLSSFAMIPPTNFAGSGSDEDVMQTGDVTMGHALMLIKSSFGFLDPILLELHRLQGTKHEVITTPQLGMERMTPLMITALTSFAIAFAAIWWNPDVVNKELKNKGLWVSMKKFDPEQFTKALRSFATVEVDDLIDYQIPLFTNVGHKTQIQMFKSLHWAVPEKDRQLWSTVERVDRFRKEKMAKVGGWVKTMKDGSAE